MSSGTAPFDLDAAPAEPAAMGATAARKRPKPGERRLQILQTLAQMLETPGAERITTAALAAALGVSEAALYRHFASKAQMFEGLIDFIERSVQQLFNQILERETDPQMRLVCMVRALLQFAERNRGLARVMVGDALVNEHERLQTRVNALADRIETQFKQAYREVEAHGALAAPAANPEAPALAAMTVSFCFGRLHRYTRSGFVRLPTEHLDVALQRLV